MHWQALTWPRVARSPLWNHILGAALQHRCAAPTLSPSPPLPRGAEGDPKVHSSDLSTAITFCKHLFKYMLQDHLTRETGSTLGERAASRPPHLPPAHPYTADPQHRLQIGVSVSPSTRALSGLSLDTWHREQSSTNTC